MLKKNAIERDVIAMLATWLLPQGFLLGKNRLGTRPAFLRHAPGVEQQIVLDVTVWNAVSAGVGFPLDFRVEVLSAIESEWGRSDEYQRRAPGLGRRGVTASKDALKRFPGGGSISLSRLEDLDAQRDQARRIVDASVAWLDRFSDIDNLALFLESATDDELMVESLFGIHDTILLSIYAYRKDVDRLRELAQRILLLPDNNVTLSRKAFAATALSQGLPE